VSVSYWQDLNKNKIREYDITVIGAGISGVSSAYWLKKEDPHLKIAIIDKGHVGVGASGRNAGFITCGSVEHFNRLVQSHGKSQAHKIWKFSEDNLDLLKNEIFQDDQTLKEGALFEQNGSFSLASTDNEYNELKNSASLMKEFQIDVEVLNEADIKKRIKAEHFVGGIKYLNDASVHPMKLLNLMLDKIQDVDVFEHSEVFDIGESSQGPIVKTRSGIFKTTSLILATNAYSYLLDNSFKDKIIPTRGQILATAPVPHFMESPCYANFVLDYFRQLPTGELIIGGFRQLQKDSEIGTSDETSPIIQNALEGFFRKYLPEFSNSPITHRWSGIMGFSSDGLPMIGSLKTAPQIFYIGGHTAHGLGLAFHCGKQLVNMIFGRETPDFLSGKRLGI
jgi:gamma-glutamylputrescine oxidase